MWNLIWKQEKPAYISSGRKTDHYVTKLKEWKILIL
jgi:hypothetical protein